MDKKLFVNAHVISPDLDLADGVILVEDGKVADILLPGEALPEDCERVDIQGDYLFPGFFDIHTHGCANFDFCDASVEGIQAIAANKLTQGVTSFLGTTLTLPEKQLAEAITIARDYMKHPTGAKIPAIHLEGPFFTAECAGAQNPDYLKLPDIGLVKRMNDFYPVCKVSYSIELDPEQTFVRELVSCGIMPAVAHSAATYENFKRATALGLKHMSHFCNVMTPLHHLNFGLVGGGMLHKDVFIEMICDGIHLCPEMIQLLFQVKGVDHIMLITDSMRAAGMPDGVYELGGLPATVKDGCARLANGRVAGSTLLYYKGLQRVRRLTELPLAQLVKTTAWNQARSLGIDGIGKIARGFNADFVRLDSTLEPVATWTDGRRAWSRG
ncbi:MAG: N-acetylglucosamine-6-phosphate deacetylase [Victivallales bacterium]|nr:N-acetylglucosamine-6-phosphate deacetylase [Victivallales bacterium]